jgi:hypothetical protein
VLADVAGDAEVVWERAVWDTHELQLGTGRPNDLLDP